MLKEWKEYNDTHDVNCSPWAIFKNSYDDFDFYLSNLETSEPKDGWVPDSTFFCFDEQRGIMVGAVNNQALFKRSPFVMRSHIGDGIRPSERRKGYANSNDRTCLKRMQKNRNQKSIDGMR